MKLASRCGQSRTGWNLCQVSVSHPRTQPAPHFPGKETGQRLTGPHTSSIQRFCPATNKPNHLGSRPTRGLCLRRLKRPERLVLDG